MKYDQGYLMIEGCIFRPEDVVCAFEDKTEKGDLIVVVEVARSDHVMILRNTPINKFYDMLVLAKGDRNGRHN